MVPRTAKRHVGAALEVRYRLPRVWERVAAGDLPFWKARFIAERTTCLPEAGAAFVDLARGQATLDYDKTARTVVLHLHGDTVFGNPNPEANLGRCDNTRTLVLAETIRAWCGNPDATIVVKPVIDLADHIHVGAYEVPDRLAAQDALVDHHCIFPWCTRPAVRCDVDHAKPYGEGGATCSCNTAPLCRGHHRLKTHGGWTYDVLERGTYLWRSPHGSLFRRDHTGTEPLDPPHRRRP